MYDRSPRTENCTCTATTTQFPVFHVCSLIPCGYALNFSKRWLTLHSLLSPLQLSEKIKLSLYVHFRAKVKGVLQEPNFNVFTRLAEESGTLSVKPEPKQ